MDGTTDEIRYEELRHDVTSAILVSQNNKTVLWEFINSFLL